MKLKEKRKQPSTLLELVLDRLHTTAEPLLRFREVEPFLKAKPRESFAAAVLVETADHADEGPHPLRPDSGEIVGFRKTSRGWFAVSLDEEWFPPIAIDQNFARQFHISLPALVNELRGQNFIIGAETAADGSLISVGQKPIEGYGIVDVYLAVANHDTVDFVTRCRAIERPHGVKKVVVFTPCPVPLANSHRELLSRRGIVVVSLAAAAARGSLAVDWDGQVVGPKEDRSADGVYPPRTLVFRGKQYRCELTRREAAFIAKALHEDEIPLGNLIHRGPDALWKQSFRNDRVTRNKVTQFLSRLNRKLAAATPAFPFFLTLPRNCTSICRTSEPNPDSTLTVG